MICSDIVDVMMDDLLYSSGTGFLLVEDIGGRQSQQVQRFGA